MNEQESFDKTSDLELLKVGISDNANLLSDDELSELFGGYCSEGYCARKYENKIAGISCVGDYCPELYY